MTDTYVLTAGGTGGHVFPAQALAAELTDRGNAVCFITDRRGNSFSGQFPQSKEYRVFAGAYANLGKVRKIKALILMAFGILQCLFILRKIKPKAVVGFGGYASFPAAFAAGILGIPLVLHEQNSVLGGANRVLAKRASLIATTFSNVAKIPPKIKTAYTGVPVRPAILALSGVPYQAPADTFDLLIFGGSQGAHILSEVIPEALKALPVSVKYRLTASQQARAADLPALERAYADSGLKIELAPFFSDMDKRLAKASLVICRAGASTIAELTAAGRPAVIVPILRSPDAHQLHNAEFMSQNNAAFLIEEPDFTPEKLTALITELFNDAKKLITVANNAKLLAKPDAATLLADAVIETGNAKQ